MRRSLLAALLAAATVLACALAVAPSVASAASSSTPAPPKEVHAFFYTWYGSPEVDGRWLHWDHDILQHWTPSIAAQYAQGKFVPPGDVGATFMPARGLYSSNDPSTLRSQCAEMKAAGVDVVVASWWPPSRPDGQGVSTDRCIPNLLDAALAEGMTVAFHLEPYAGRSAESVRGDIGYIHATYGSHRGLYRHPLSRRPLVYVYDSYHTPAADWAELFDARSSITIRGTEADVIALGLMLEPHDRESMKQAHFDGWYTYFAAQGFSFGSTTSNWKQLAAWAKEDGMIFIPSVGPGYDDTRLRPWNSVSTRPRNNGAYYRRMFEAALDCEPSVISLTSYNEWGEGTQLESAVPFRSDKGEQLQDYGEGGPAFYMDLTGELVRKFKGDAAVATDDVDLNSKSELMGNQQSLHTPENDEIRDSEWTRFAAQDDVLCLGSSPPDAAIEAAAQADKADGANDSDEDDDSDNQYCNYCCNYGHGENECPMLSTNQAGKDTEKSKTAAILCLRRQ